MKYRILKNDDHYIIQRKDWFFWRYSHGYGGDETYWKLSQCKAEYYVFRTQKSAEEELVRIIQKDVNYKKKNSKYTTISTAITSPLYEAINEDKNEKK